jgi:hypothetical protein
MGTPASRAHTTDNSAPSAPEAEAPLLAEPRSPVALAKAIQSAVEKRRISSRLGRELLVRLLPPQRRMVNIALPVVSDPQSFLRACQSIMEAVAAGKLAPVDAPPLLKIAKSTLEAARLVERARR